MPGDDGGGVPDDAWRSSIPGPYFLFAWVSSMDYVHWPGDLSNSDWLKGCFFQL